MYLRWQWLSHFEFVVLRWTMPPTHNSPFTTEPDLRAVELFDPLSDEQIAAIVAPVAPMKVLAGPGSGKTRVLVGRVTHLINELGVPPSHILCITFTNKAAREMRDRDDLNKALCVGLAGSFLLYSILAVSVAYSFGSIAKAANCQWDAFGVGIQYSALLDGIRWLVVLFPAVDVFSVYPLNISIAADTLVTLFAGDRADRAQRQVGYRRAMRACVALPPIIGAGCMANLTAMIDTAGILVFAICCGFPPLLSVLGKNKCRAAFGDGRLDTTRYTPDGGRTWPKYAVAAFGTVAFVIAVGTPG